MFSSCGTSSPPVPEKLGADRGLRVTLGRLLRHLVQEAPAPLAVAHQEHPSAEGCGEGDPSAAESQACRVPHSLAGIRTVRYALSRCLGVGHHDDVLFLVEVKGEGEAGVVENCVRLHPQDPLGVRGRVPRQQRPEDADLIPAALLRGTADLGNLFATWRSGTLLPRRERARRRRPWA